jgi:hypothetical protein
MQHAIILTEDETWAYEHGDKKIASVIESMRRGSGTDTVIGDDGDQLYDVCFVYRCPHEKTYCNDRMQTVCDECGEDLGR